VTMVSMVQSKFHWRGEIFSLRMFSWITSLKRNVSSSTKNLYFIVFTFGMPVDFLQDEQHFVGVCRHSRYQ
jgi:hypothetical protein